MAQNGSAPTVVDCLFLENQSAGDGGAVVCYEAGHTYFINCTFAGNVAGNGGGGFTCGSSAPTLVHCTFFDNSAWAGSGIHSFDPSGPSIFCLENTIIAFGTGGGAVWANGVPPALSCCDIFGNEGGDWTGNIADQLGTNGNLEADPLFCLNQNPEEPLTLDANSPCAPQQQPECGLFGAWPVACGAAAGVPLPGQDDPNQQISWGAIKALFLDQHPGTLIQQ